MPKLRTKKDDWSFQITSPESRYFFVRITSEKEDKSSLVFSDFLFGEDETSLALAALRLVNSEFYGPVPDMTLRFENILPSPSATGKKQRLLLDSKQVSITSVVETFFVELGLAKASANIVEKLGKFDLVITIK